MRLAPGQDSADRRAQAIQIGALLLFAIAVINLSLYQAFVVPNQNQEIEFKHNQQVHDQMENARGTLLRTSITGSDLSASVDLAPQYPSRALFVNPGPPAGSLRTGDLGTIEVRNARAIRPETRDWWDGSARSYGTKRLAYQPGYNIYANAPDTVYENSVVYNDFSPTGNDRRLSLTGQSVVNGKGISMVALNGSLSTSGTGSESLDFKPVSASTTQVAVQNDSLNEPLTVEIPTELTRDEWVAMLDDEHDPDGSTTNPDAGASTRDGKYLQKIECANAPPQPCGTLTLTFETKTTYDLRLAKVGVGSGATDTSATYVVRSDPGTQSVTVSEGTTREFVVEVRDEYDNPTSGVEVTADDPAGLGSLSSTSARTDADGLATFEYDAAGTGTETLTFQFDGGGTDRKEVQYDVTVTDADGSDSGTGDGSGGDGSRYGTGGESTYDGENPTQTVSVRNGQLTGITSTDELILSGAVPTVDTNDGKDRLEYETALDNGTTTYTVQLRLVKGLTKEDWNTRSVTIFDDTGNSQSATLTKEAAAGINGSQTAYDGTDLLDVNNVAYNDPGSSFNRSAAEVRGMDDDGDTTVTALTTSIDGRVNSTIREEALYSAAQSQPSDGSDYEFVRVNFESPTETTGWTITDDEDDETTLPDTTLEGEIYFAADETAFEDERGLADDVVYPLDTPLEDPDALTLTDARDERRDEVAFESDNDEDPSTSRSWTVSDVHSGEVAVRESDSLGYRDANEAADWRVVSQTGFFGTDNPSVAFTNNADGDLIRTVDTEGTVIEYGTDTDGIRTLGPKTDLDGDGQDEVLYVDGGNALEYMGRDGTVTTLVDSKVKATSVGVGENAAGDTVVYYATTNGNKLSRVTTGGSSTKVSVGNGNNAVDAIGAVGYADVNGDGDDNPIYLSSSSEIGYIDLEKDSVETAALAGGDQFGSGSGTAVGVPVSTSAACTNVCVPIVNGSNALLLIDPDDGSNETVPSTFAPTKSPITVRDWRGDATKELLVINGNDNNNIYWVEIRTGDTPNDDRAHDSDTKKKGVR